ncbi:MAG: LuxR C-terminal-related transcriptional regulator [Solirubrobacterales bacterium]
MSDLLTVDAVAQSSDPSAIADPGTMIAPRLRRITMLLVDEQPIVKLGVSLIAEDSPRPCRLVWATSGEAAIEAARRERPDLVLLDPSLGDVTLTDSVRRVGAVSPASRIILFPAHVTPSIREEAARLDVHGLLSKDASPNQFLLTMEAVTRGERILEEEQCDALRRAAVKLNCAPLTPREHEIIRRAARGESNAEIASAIFLAPTTVKSYVQSALGKLEARNRVEAVFKLAELRLL